MSRSVRLTLAFGLFITGLWLVGDALLYAATAPDVPPHAVLRVGLPGIDLGVDAQPAQYAAPGYVEVWVYPHAAQNYRPLLRVYGAPALGGSPAPLKELPPPTPTRVWRYV